MTATELRKSKIQLYKALQGAFDEVTSYLLDTVDDDTNWEDAEPELDDLRMDLDAKASDLFAELWPGKTANDPAVQHELA